MPDATVLFNITPVPLLSVLVWILLAIAAMYFARRPFHQAMAALSRLIYSALRLAATSVNLSRQRLEARNQEVFLASGIDHATCSSRYGMASGDTFVCETGQAYLQTGHER